jgi:hypothetical protein
MIRSIFGREQRCGQHQRQQGGALEAVDGGLNFYYWQVSVERESKIAIFLQYNSTCTKIAIQNRAQPNKLIDVFWCAQSMLVPVVVLHESFLSDTFVGSGLAHTAPTLATTTLIRYGYPRCINTLGSNILTAAGCYLVFGGATINPHTDRLSSLSTMCQLSRKSSFVDDPLVDHGLRPHGHTIGAK